MSLHDSDAVMDVATNVQAVANSMEWDSEERKNVPPAASSSSSSTPSTEYQLSATLGGHDYGVRDACAASIDAICTVEDSEHGRTSIFHRAATSASTASAGIWTKDEQFDGRIHKKSICFVVTNVEGCKMKGEARSNGQQQLYYPKGTFMSGGGSDKAARAFTQNGTQFNALADHGGPVGSISYTHPDRYVITGSWDGIVRVWNGDELIRKFDKLGHQHGTEVLGLENGHIVTASSTGNIVLIDIEGRVIKKIQGHSAPVRKLIAHPLGFASAGNEGVVKVWSREGELLQTIEASTMSEVKYLYGLCLVSFGSPLAASVDLDKLRLITSGEDGYVRIFDTTGRKLQELVHPGPVRSVKPIGFEGDFMTACADKNVRIFTRDPTRFATEKERGQFKEMMELVKANGIKALDTSTLENEDALQKPGTKDGQTKVLNITGRKVPIAFQWSNDLHEWIEIGEAMGATNSNGPQQKKSKLEGKEYDFVSDIYLTDEHKVQLGFNADDDPTEVTDRFCAMYQIPADMREQIFAFVQPKCDMAAVAHRKAAHASSSSSVIVLQQVPSWTSGSFEMYSGGKFEQMEKAINDANALLAQQINQFAITSEQDSKSLTLLFLNLRDITQYHSAPFTAGEQTVIKKLLQWPTEHILPVMDACRLLMMHSSANAALGENAQVQTLLLQHVAAGRSVKTAYEIMLFKIVSNWVAKRQRSQQERSDQPSVPVPVVEFLVRLLDECAAAAASEVENVALAYVMLTHNIICWYGRLRIAESELYPLIASGICELLNHKRNTKIQFYALLTLGSMAYASDWARDILKTTFTGSFTALIGEAAKSDNPALKQVAQDCKLLFQLS